MTLNDRATNANENALIRRKMIERNLEKGFEVFMNEVKNHSELFYWVEIWLHSMLHMPLQCKCNRNHNDHIILCLIKQMRLQLIKIIRTLMCHKGTTIITTIKIITIRRDTINSIKVLKDTIITINSEIIKSSQWKWINLLLTRVRTRSVEAILIIRARNNQEQPES